MVKPSACYCKLNIVADKHPHDEVRIHSQHGLGCFCFLPTMYSQLAGGVRVAARRRRYLWQQAAFTRY